MSVKEAESDSSCASLDLSRVVGFNGNVKDGLHIVEGNTLNH